MKNKYITLALVAVVAMTGAVGTASAQEPTTSNIKQERDAWMQKLRAERANFNEIRKVEPSEIRKVWTERKEKAETYRAETRETVKAGRDDLRARLEGADTDEERKEIRDEAREKAKDFRGQVKDDRAGFKEKNTELRKDFKAKATDRLRGSLVQISKRLDGALDRFDKLSERIQDFIDKRVAAGTDMSEAQAALDESSVARDAAEAQVVKVKEMAREILASETPRELLKELRGAIKEAAAAIREANKQMKEAIREARVTGRRQHGYVSGADDYNGDEDQENEDGDSN